MASLISASEDPACSDSASEDPACSDSASEDPACSDSASEDPACSDSASVDISAPAETTESAQISGISPKNPLSIQTCLI